MGVFSNYDEDCVVKFKKTKPSGKFDVERPHIMVKGNHETPDELAKDIAKALKKSGYKQQAKAFRSDADAIIESGQVTDSDVMKIAAKYCICNYAG
jgi:hypothetical protein